MLSREASVLRGLFLWLEGRDYPATRRTLCGLMRSSSGEGGLLAGWRSDAVVIPNPKNIHGNAAGGDWNGVCESQLRKRGAFQWQSVLEKTAGRDQVSTEAFGKGGMDLALADLGKGTFSRKGPLPLRFLRLQSLSALECVVALFIRPAPLLQRRRGSG